MTKIFFLLFFAFAPITIAGCAFDIVHVKQVPVQFENANTIKPGFELKDEVEVNLGTGYSRRLKKGTKWHYVSCIPYGDIFKTNDQILTVEGSNIFEAFIVVSGDNLVGFFLPVQQTYTPLSEPEPLVLVRIEQ